MTENVEIVRKLFDACNKKDAAAVKSLVDPDYTLKDPLMELHGADELVEMLKSGPDCTAENVTFVAEGDKVVSLFDMVSEGQPKLRMCSVITLADGKVKSEEMFYDTAKLPPEMKNVMQKGKASGDAAGTAH